MLKVNCKNFKNFVKSLDFSKYYCYAYYINNIKTIALVTISQKFLKNFAKTLDKQKIL